MTLIEFLNMMSQAIGPLPVWVWYCCVIAVVLACVRAIYPRFVK
jgi:hypothetical protein